MYQKLETFDELKKSKKSSCIEHCTSWDKKNDFLPQSLVFRGVVPHAWSIHPIPLHFGLFPEGEGLSVIGCCWFFAKSQKLTTKILLDEKIKQKSCNFLHTFQNMAHHLGREKWPLLEVKQKLKSKIKIKVAHFC